jgi:hypothetical protein
MSGHSVPAQMPGDSMNEITPMVFGRICEFAAEKCRQDYRQDVAIQLTVSHFSDCDPIDVADAAEGAVEQWQRLQIREPE